MINKLKKFLRLYEILKIPAIVVPPLRVLKKLNYNRIPRSVFKEFKVGKTLAPLKTILYLYNWLKYETITKMSDRRYVINSFLPPMPGMGYKRMFVNLLSGRNVSPVSAYIAVTSQCFCDCWHCSYKNRQGKSLSTEQILDVIDELIKIGVSIIGFTGGEPLLNKDIVKIVSYASKKADIMLFTNGYNLNEPLALQLKKAGLWALAVSLDSSQPLEHDKKRALENAYNNAIDAIRLAKAQSFYTMVTSVPDSEMIKSEEYLKIYKLSASLEVDEYRLVEPMPAGKILSSEQYLLTQQLREKLNNFHKKTNHKNLSPKVCSFSLIESPEYFGCCAGNMHLFIDNFGNVCPCDFIPISFGNLHKDSFLTCWERLQQYFYLPAEKCFMQQYYKIFEEYKSDNLPVNYLDIKEKLDNLPKPSLPAYFKHVMSNNKTLEG